LLGCQSRVLNRKQQIPSSASILLAKLAQLFCIVYGKCFKKSSVDFK
jgi:hypothetical protein